MTLLLDVNVLIAAIWTDHADHKKADAGITGRKLASCPVSEMGFIRISTHPKGLNVSMRDARRLLKQFLVAHAVKFLPADLPVLKSSAAKSDTVTDSYLADLAATHGMALATLDKGIKHPAVVLIA
jgi:toxin-antitoxin system PIN domain toxin